MAVPLLAAVAVGVAAGCSNRTSDRDISLLDVTEAREIAVGTARARRAEERTAWVDPRTASDWLTERIPGAIHVPVGSMRERAEELRAYDRLIVYGRGYKDPVAYAAAKVLGDLRVAEVRVLEGGLTAWMNAGHDVASGSPAPGEAIAPASPDAD